MTHRFIPGAHALYNQAMKSLPTAIIAPLGLLLALLLMGACDQVGDWEEGQCDDGELDRPRFCDRSGDLVADRHPDEDRWLDPDTLIFAYTPVEDPAQYREVWDEFIDYLEEKTGRDVQFFAAGSNAAQIEAMRAGRLHIAGFSTGAVPLAVNCAGFVPTAMRADGDDFGYEMEIITHVDSGLESLEDLGPEHTFAFTSPTSNSGFKTPSVLLEEEFGLVAGQDFDEAYSGGHDNSLIGVFQRDYDAAAVANEVTDRIMDRGDVPRDQIRNLYTSDTFPTTAFGPAYNLHPDLVEAIEEAFFSFPWEGSVLGEEFSDADRFRPINYKDYWDMIRTVDASFEDGYSCR